MNNACLITLLFLLIAASVAVIVMAVRSIWREMTDDDDAPARRTEERKNERIRRQLEQWRDGE